jgi:hypothetical protein
MRSPAASWRDALGFRPMTVRSCVIREAPFIGSPLIESIPPQVQPALRGNLKAASPFEASASIRYRGYVEASRYRRRLPAGNLQCLDSRIGHQPRNRRDPVALVTHYPLPHKPTARTGRPAADQQPASASGTQPSQTATPPRSPHSPRTRKLRLQVRPSSRDVEANQGSEATKGAAPVEYLDPADVRFMISAKPSIVREGVTLRKGYQVAKEPNLVNLRPWHFVTDADFKGLLRSTNIIPFAR